MTDKSTIDLGQEVTIRMKDQEACYLLGALSYIEQKLGQEGTFEELVEHLADSGVDPEADTERDLLTLAKVSIIGRQEFKPQVFEIGRLHSICHLPPIWALGYIDLSRRLSRRRRRTISSASSRNTTLARLIDSRSGWTEPIRRSSRLRLRHMATSRR